MRWNELGISASVVRCDNPPQLRRRCYVGLRLTEKGKQSIKVALFEFYDSYNRYIRVRFGIANAPCSLGWTPGDGELQASGPACSKSCLRAPMNSELENATGWRDVLDVSQWAVYLVDI